jgi:DNA-binding XRE family transcriptional regulator
MTTDTFKAEYRTSKGKRVVLLREAAFEQLLRLAELWEPALPAADADGNRPAEGYAAVSLARDILRARRKIGLSQVELARRAGIQPETLNRIEQGKNKPSVPTIAKIDRAAESGGSRGLELSHVKRDGGSSHPVWAGFRGACVFRRSNPWQTT